VKYLDLGPYVRSEAQGVPDYLLERSVREAAIDFCVTTDVYRPEPEQVNVSAGISEYDLSIPAGTELNHIIDIFRDRDRLTPVSYARLLEITGDGTSSGLPTKYSQRDNTVFYLAPMPSSAETLSVLYSLKPSAASTAILHTVGKEHREAIVHGTLYRLQMMPNQPWSSMGQAQNNKVLCDKRKSEIMRQVRYGYAGAALTVRSRGFI